MQPQIESVSAGYLSMLALVGLAVALGALRKRHPEHAEGRTEHSEGEARIRGVPEDAKQRDADDQRAKHCGGALGSQGDRNVA